MNKRKISLICLSFCLMIGGLSGCREAFQETELPKKETVADARKNRIHDISADALEQEQKENQSKAYKTYQEGLAAARSHLSDTSYIPADDLEAMASIVKKNQILKSVIGKRADYFNTNFCQTMPAGQIESFKMLEFYEGLLSAAQSKAQIQKNTTEMQSIYDSVTGRKEAPKTHDATEKSASEALGEAKDALKQ